jgi:D-3-phosphoglycerate dehydrogenase
MIQKKNRTVLTTTSSFAKDLVDIIAPLQRAGINLICNPYGRTLIQSELNGLLEKYQPVGLLAGTEKIDRATLVMATGYLRVISRVGAGWDNIDRETAQELGIRVYRTEGVLADAVAELTLGLILSSLRHICLQDQLLKQGKWQKQMGSLLKDKTIGIVGFGVIGRRVGELAKAFGCTIIFNDAVQINVDWADSVTLSELLERAQIITIHASGNTKIIDHEMLTRIGKNGVVIVNTARGDLIDEGALYQGLLDGRIGYACLDVFEKEPYEGPLQKLNNVILTPHIGSYANEARQQMERFAVEHLLDGLRGAAVI